MQMLPIDLTSLVAVIMGISVVLIPVAGLTARFALKPAVEALGRFIEGKGKEEAVHVVERRIALLEQQLEVLQTSVDRLIEVSEFDAALKGASTRGELPPKSHGSSP